MKRKLAVLMALAALAVLALPASSMAGMSPAGHKFEISGGLIPKLATPLGSCSLASVTSTIPAAPANDAPFTSAATVTPGSCSAGTTISINGEWSFVAGKSQLVQFGSTNPEALVMRFSSLPGCKLAGTYKVMGLWSNGWTSPTLQKSGFLAHSSVGLKWANDGGSCALAGKEEGVAYLGYPGTGSAFTAMPSAVNDLTVPGSVVLVNGK